MHSVRAQKPVRPLSKSLSKLSSAAAICAALVGSTSHAVDTTWTAASGTDLLWSTGGNWNTLAEPTAIDAVFFATPIPAVPGADVVTLAAGELALSLSFADNYTLTGGDLTLGAGGNITVAAGKTALVQSTLIGGNGLTKIGTGTLTLSGINTFTGAVDVTGGILSIAADANLGDVANGVTLTGGTLDVTGTFTSARVLTLGTGGGTVSVTSGQNLTLSSAPAANANALTKADGGTLTLGAGSTRSGTTAISDGRIAVTNLSALGSGAVTVTGPTSVYEVNTGAGTSAQAVNVVDGGTFQWTQNAQLTLGAGLPLSFSGTGGTIFVGGAGSSGKVFAGAGLVASTAGSTVVKTGGGVLQLSGANTGFLGDVSIQAGTVEFQNVDSLGTAVKTITIGGTGDLATSGVTNRNNIILNTGGTISANNAAAIYSGSINVAGNGTVALRQFQSVGTAVSFGITGGLTGAGNLGVTAPAAATLTLSGANTGFTGTLTAGTNATVLLNSRLGDTASLGFAGGTISNRAANLASPTVGVAGIDASYYNFGFNPNASNNPIEFASYLLVEPQRVFSRIDPRISIPNGGGGTFPVVPVPGYQFNVNDGAMWKGLLHITAPGNYQFSAINDDNAVLFIDGVQIGTIGVNGGGANVGGAVNLAAGAHSIVWKFSQGGGGGYTELRYNGTDTGGNSVAVGSVAGSLTTGSLAPVDFGALNAVSGTSTFDTGVDVTAGTFSGTGGATLNLTSGTLSKVTVTGPSTLTGAGTVTLNPNTASLTFDDAIGGSGVGLTLNGANITTFNAANTYDGLTTVSAGRLVLNAGGGNAIAGNLTVNAANAIGRIRNVVLNQSNQIADTATVTVNSFGIVDLGANSETISTLVVNGVGAEVIGSGTLTAGTLDLRQGLVSASLQSAGGVTKNTPNTVTLSGANTYTGLTAISNGVLNIRSSAGLGAVGAGNETSVTGTGQLQFQGDITVGEPITISSAPVDGTGALRFVSGDVNLTAGFTLASNAAVQVDTGITTILAPIFGGGNTLTVQGDGVLVVGVDPAATGATVVKNGRGALVYGSTLAAFPAVTHNAGIIGFVGTQNLGATTVPAGLSYLFSGDPGAGTTVNVPAGTSLLQDGSGANGLLSRVGTGAGSFVLTSNSATNLNFAGKSVGLGALGLVDYSGTITPDAAGYHFNGLQAGIGDGIALNRLSLSVPLTGANSMTVTSGILDLTDVVNTQAGTVTVGAGGILEVLNNPNLGAASNGITLDGGTLRLINVSGSAGQIFGHLGNPVNGGFRIVTVGAAGGTLDVPTFSNNNNGYMLGGNFSTALTGDPLAGTGTLRKTGLGFLFLNNASDFEGNFALAANSGTFDLRGTGSWVPTVPTTLTVGQSSTLQLDSRNNLGSGRQITNQYIADRIGANVSIVLEGGSISNITRNAAGQVREDFGTITLGAGQNAFNVDKEGQGEDHTIANLITQPGGTVRFGGDSGTFGSTGDNARVVLTQVNGAAPATDHIGGFATIFGTNFVGHGATGVVIANGTAQGAAAWAPGAGTVYNLNAGGTATISDEGDDIAEMRALRFGSNAAQTLAFADGADTLYIGSGGILTEGSNVARSIGAAVNSGKITAGDVGATGLQQLYFHNNSNTVTVNSNIVDNSGTAPVAIVKALDAQVTLAAANTYTGGTFVTRGTLQANVAGSLGSGSVLVKNSRLNLQVAGTNTGTNGFTAVDNGEILLNNSTAAFTTPGDRFVINPGATIIGPNAGNANQGLNSLTRVAGAPANGGEIQLFPGAIVGHQLTPAGEIGTGTTTIKNLGTAADLFFGLSNTFSDVRTTLTIGAGTPWKGISTDRNARTWEEGTILANSDFWLQGTTRDSGVAALSLGSGSTGAYSIVNQAGRSINAYVAGQVVLAEDSPVSLPSNLTFVLTAGSLMQPNVSGSLGSNADISLNAKVRVLAGGTFDPGNFVGVGTVVNQPQGHPYPVPSPANGFITVEAGGRFLNNDASGIGSTTPGAWTIKANGILDLGNGQAFLGSNSGLINDGQFVFEPDAIIRLTNDNRYFKLDQFVNSAPNGQRLTYQIFNSDKSLTDAVDPRIVVTPGTATVVPMTFTLSNGGMLTNDNSDRTVRERRGGLILGDGAILAGTSQTYFNIQENWSAQAGATVQIGSTRWVDGQPKTGAVQLNGPASNTAGTGVVFNVTDGSQLSFGNVHVFPDTAAINLATAVTAFPAVGGSSPQPGVGSSLLLNTDNYVEVMGPLTGAGAVIGNQGTPVFAPGFGATSDFVFDGVVKSAFTRNPHMIKVGPTRMTLTNFSDTTGVLAVMQGELALGGAGGRWQGGEWRVGKGASLIYDNSGTAVANRFGSAGTLTTLGGGDFRLVGNSTQVADVIIGTLANAATGNVSYGGNTGGFGRVTVLPSGDLTALRTSVTFGQVERFDTAGERNSVWLLRGSGLGGLPGTYSAAGAYTPNAGNPVDGLVFITAPRFTGSGVFDVNGGALGLVHGAPGTPAVPTSGLLLGSTSPTANEGEFVTIDIASGAGRTGVRLLQASEYALTTTANANLGINVRATGALNLNDGDTRFQVLKMENGSSLGVAGTYPNLTQPAQVVLNGGGILIPAGSTASISASDNGTGLDSLIRTQGGVSAYIHAFGNVSVNGEFFSDVGLVKTGAGTATFAAGSLTHLRGRVALHEGTLNINDSLSNVRGAAISAVAFQGSHLELNGGTLNVNGNSQMFGRLESGNFLTGAAHEGGTITSATPATITVVDAGGFSGHISGALSYNKLGNNTHILHGTNGYTGSTNVQQGVMLLRADATLSGTSEVNLNYARIDIDDGYLAYVQDRINPAATVNIRGGDFVNRGRAGILTQQHFGTVNVLAGTNLFQTLAGGGGATETHFNVFNRSAGTMVSFQQNYGFIGTAGNDTTAIRYLINNISVNGGAATTPAALATTNNGILGGWAIVNNDHFATYDPVRGIGAMSNTEDGFRNYESGDLTLAGATQNVNDGGNRTVAASKTVNSIRHAPGAAQTITLSAGVTLTIGTGGLITNANQAITYTGGSLTSGSGELYLWIQQNTTTINSQITGSISLVKGGNSTLKLQGPGNNYTGPTFIGSGSSGSSNRSGLTQLDVTGANGTTIVAIPGDLHIHQAQVDELREKQIAETANVYLYGGAVLSLVNVAGVTETLNSVNFRNPGGQDFNRGSVLRAGAQATSTLRLTGATPVSSINENTVDIPGFHGQVGNLAFAGPNGTPQVLDIQSPVTATGLGAAGLLIDPVISQVPTGVDDGGLVKAGNGMLVLRGVNTFGNPVTPTEVFNIQSGAVRVDNPGPLGGTNAITTVQNGAVLLLNGNAGLTGSLQLKNGSTLGGTLASATIGAVPSTGTIEVPAGAATTVAVYDYFVRSTNGLNIVVNHKLTGSGTIDMTGIEYASGYNGGGIFQLRNPSNDFSGTINIGTNTVLEANPNDADLSGNTFGTAALNLNGGVLRVRDQANNLAGAETISYANNVTLNASSLIDVDRLGTVATNKTIAFGTLTIPSGAPVLSTPYGTGAPITPNGYRTSFSQVAGAGTLVKGGSRFIDIDGYAPGFSGNIEVEGPQGLSLPTSGNLTLNAPINAINKLTVRGFHTFAAGKTVTVADTLEVSNNAGEVANGLNGLSTGGIVGAVTLNSTSAVSANLVRNRGIIAADNSAATLASSAFVGSGLYQAYGQSLTLDGTFADDGASPTTIRSAGTAGAAVVLTSAGSANTGGAEVQTGILRVAPTGGTATNPLGTGAIRVMGAPASPLAAGSQPIAAQVATLEFAGTAITQNGSITNSGTVRVSSGVTTINGTIQGTPSVSATQADFLAGTVPGLLEGRLTTTGGLPDTDANGRSLSGTRSANPGNFGVKLEPRMGQMNVVTGNGLTGWSDNTAWIYTGYFYDADGVFTFMENIDDSVLVSIDGVDRLLNNSGTNPWQTVTSTATSKGQRGNALDTGTPNTAAGILGLTPIAANPNLPAGWHSIEIRFDNGGGGGGSVVGNGFTNNYGFGFNPNGTMALDGTQAFRPIDAGDGTLFRTAASGNGNIEIGAAGNAAAVALNATGLTQAGVITLNGGATDITAAKLALTGGSNHDATGLTVAGGAFSFGAVDLVTNSTLTVGTLTVPDGGQLTVNAAGGTGILDITTTHTLAATSKVILEAGTLRFNGTGGSVGAEVQVFTDATVNVGGTLTGTLTVNGGTLTGTGTIVGPVSLTGGGAIAPGNSPGILTVQSIVSDATSTFDFEIGAPSAGFGYDQLKVTGDTINLDGATLSLSVTSALVPDSILNIIWNQGADADPGSFGNYLHGSQFTLPGGSELRISYFDDPATTGVLELAGGSSVSLLVVVPEPGSAALLLGGLGSLLAMRRRRKA